MISNLNLHDTPLNRAIFDDSLYPDVDIDLFNVKRTLIVIRDIDNMIMSTIWDETKKYIENIH